MCGRLCILLPELTTTLDVASTLKTTYQADVLLTHDDSKHVCGRTGAVARSGEERENVLLTVAWIVVREVDRLRLINMCGTI